MNADSPALVVIGGGPAGMMCAYQAAKRGLAVTLLEPNDKLGRKLRITGKGRCNLTNNCDVKTFMANIPGDGRFLYSALSRLGPAETMAFFEENGLPLKTERGNRVFPQSDNANDVANLMASLCRRAGVRILKRRAGQIIIDATEKYFKQYAFHACRNTTFELAVLGNDAGMYGGARAVLV